jgi:hypothetical protein
VEHGYVGGELVGEAGPVDDVDGPVPVVLPEIVVAFPQLVEGRRPAGLVQASNS